MTFGIHNDYWAALLCFLLCIAITVWGFRCEFPNGIRTPKPSNARGRATTGRRP